MADLSPVLSNRWRGRRVRGVLLGLALAVSGPLSAQAVNPAHPDVIDEIVVTGERAGPSMWHVHKGDAHVWVLGSMSPLPRGITWRSHQVEEVLTHADQVLVQRPVEINIPRVLWVMLTNRSLLMVTGGKKLKDVMPPELHNRFDALRGQYTDDRSKWERYRPIVATLFLQQAAFHQAGLSLRMDMGAAVRKLAKDAHVKVDEIKMAGVGDMFDALKTLSPDAENTCVNASLVTIQSAIPRYKERADAWVNGDIERLQTLPIPKEVDACREAMDQGKGAADLLTRMRQSWLFALEKELKAPGTTIAVVNLDLLLDKGGVLDGLRAAGFEIDAPH